MTVPRDLERALATHEPLLMSDVPDYHVHVCNYVEDGRIVKAYRGQILIFVNSDWQWEMCIAGIIRINNVGYCLACGHKLW